MNAARFAELKAHPERMLPEELRQYQQLIRWEKRSDAAKRAVVTKRQRYKAWPTRKGTHK